LTAPVRLELWPIGQPLHELRTLRREDLDRPDAVRRIVCFFIGMVFWSMVGVLAYCVFHQ
jgi:hypothetical protein